MKKILLSCVLLGVVICTAKCQVPKKVLEAFKTRYRNSQNIDWLENEDNFEVEFRHKGIFKVATFKKHGSWIMTTTPILVRELASCMIKRIETDYSGMLVSNLEFIETPNSKKYHVFIETDKNKIIELTFDSDCEFLGKV